MFLYNIVLSTIYFDKSLIKIIINIFIIIIIIIIIIIGTALIIKLRLSFQWQRCFRKP